MKKNNFLLREFNSFKLFFLYGVVLASGCGVEIGNPKKPGNDKDTFVVDEQNLSSELADVVISDSLLQVKDNYSSVQSQTNETDTALMLAAENDSELNLVFNGEYNFLPADNFQCEKTLANGINGTLSIYESSREESKNALRSKAKVKFKYSSSLRKELKFTTPDVALACSAKKVPIIPWHKIKTLEHAVSIKKSNSRILESGDQQAAKAARSRIVEFKSDRNVVDNITWDSVKQELEINQKISFHSVQTLTLSQSAGDEKKLEHTVNFDFPWSVVLKYKNKQFYSKVLNSGSQTSTSQDGSVMKLKYSNIVYEQNSVCAPKSGGISGVQYLPDGTTVKNTFEIEFVNGAGKIKKNGGEEEYYEVECNEN